MKIFKVLFFLVCLFLISEDLIVKSSIIICENIGGGDDFMSVVYEKVCEKKFIVIMLVWSG